MKGSSFNVELGESTAHDFAKMSGDWNPLHTDEEHAKKTSYGRPILHGAYSAGLVSRMAGMHLPGKYCLLHSMRMRFVAPIQLPVSLTVRGRVVAEHTDGGAVEVQISDAATGRRYVEASYEFAYHDETVPTPLTAAARHLRSGRIIVTGASGALGGALVTMLGEDAIVASHRSSAAGLADPDLNLDRHLAEGQQIDAIVHCGWPSPDNTRLTKLENASAAIEHHISQPLRHVVNLARLLAKRGTDGAMLVLVGSTFASSGRHAYRMPLYSLGKALLPEATRALSIELAATKHRCVTVSFDVIDAGMNSRLSAHGKRGHADRVPSGSLPSAADAASQLLWVLENRSSLVSGAALTLSGGALP